MDSLLSQYIIVALVVLFAAYLLFKKIRKNLSLKKFKKNDSSCDKDCGCS